MMLRLCCGYNLMHFILNRLLLMIMGHFVDLNIFEVCKRLVILDIVNNWLHDRLRDAIIVCYSFVNYRSWDIKRALI